VRKPISSLAAVLLVLVGLTGAAVAAAPAATAATAAAAPSAVTVTNFDSGGHDVARFDTSGAAVDAHDGEIQQFTYQGVTRYYWYGTQDDCGLGWQRTQISGAAEPTPWCGYAIYSSDDLNTWTYQGTIDSSANPALAKTCDWNSCWRPKVVFDPNTDLYVAWGNTLLGPSGYSAWTSPSPIGPWTSRGNPSVGLNAGVITPYNPANQDEGLFVDQDGTGYVIITDASGGAYSPVVEQLTPDFLGTTGSFATMPVSQVESPTMFKHGGRYYTLVSSPNAGYTTTGTAYLWATSPLGPWTLGSTISADSFGGQPTFATTWQTTDGRSIAVYESDVWYQPGHLAPNQGLAGFDLSRITWAADGITPVIDTARSWTEDLRFANTGVADQTLPDSAFHAPDQGNWYVTCDVRSGTQRSFTFVAPDTGVLADLKVPVARSEYPDHDGELDLAAGSNAPGAAVLATAALPASGSGWSARPYDWRPNVPVVAGTTYTVTLRSADHAGSGSCYGFAYQLGGSTMGNASRQTGAGAWTTTGETVKFDLGIRSSVPRGAVVVTSPVRLADTSIEGGYADRIQVAGVGSVPAGAIGAWVNISVDGPATDGSLAAYPGDGPTTTAATFPYATGRSRSYAALVRLGYDGTLDVSSTADVSVTVDLTGWVTDDTLDAAGGRLTILPTPVRALNTQTGGGPIGAGGHLDVAVTGGPVPAGARAALVNLTAVSPTAATTVSAFPTGGTALDAPTVMASVGQVAVANRALVPLSAAGSIRLANAAGQVGMVVDVIGYVAPGTGTAGEVAPLDPVALSSPNPAAVPATFSLAAAPVTAAAGLPGQGSAVLALGQQTSVASFGQVYRSGGSPPATSDVNTAGGSAVAVNQAAVNLGGSTAVEVGRQAASGTSTLAVTGWVLAGGSAHVPSPPLAVTAQAGSGTATVSWSPPADTGGLPIFDYTVKASPSGAICAWTSGPTSCVVGGLPDGVAQTFTATATNALGTSAPSVASAPVTPVGSGYTPVTPVRVLDTRFGPVPPGEPTAGPLQPGDIWTLPLAGTNGIPVNATAVVVNVTATDVRGSTFVTAWPSGQSPPATSNLNVVADDTRANLATVALGADGAIRLRSAQATTDLVVDLEGYYSIGSANRYTPLAPARLLDTRDTGSALAGGETLTLPVTGHGGVPAGATAVVVNLTVADTTASTFVTAYPAGQPLPLASSLNVDAGTIRPNRVIVSVGVGGAISLYNFAGRTDLVVDVVGAFRPTGTDLFQPSSPVRILDTRTALVPPAWASGQPLGQDQTLNLPVAGNGGVPASATSVMMNLTATDVTSPSFVSVSPAGGGVATTSDLNPVPGDVGANLVIATLGTGGAVQLYNLRGTVDLVADVSGWFYRPGPGA
jgi:hypothetical protein